MAGGHAAKRAAQLIQPKEVAPGKVGPYLGGTNSHNRLLANTASGYCGLPREPL